MMENYIIRNPQIDVIIDQVCEDFFTTREAVLSASRKKEITTVRHAIMYLAREHKEFSLKQIGAHLGNRDYTTVIHGVSAMEGLIFVNKLIRQKIEDLRITVALALNKKVDPSGGQFREEESFETPNENTFSFLLEKDKKINHKWEAR